MIKKIYLKFKKSVLSIRSYLLALWGIRNFKGSDWLGEVIECQKEIIFTGANPYYKTNYHTEEVCYWAYIAKWIKEDSQQNKVHSILDIGCAYGTLCLYAMKKYKCVASAVDFIGYLSREITERYGIKFRICNVELDPLPWREKFDRIIFTEVFEHLFNPVLVLKKIGLSLSDGGKLFLSTPDARRWGKINKYYASFEEMMSSPKINTAMVDDHIFLYTREELVEVLDKSGFKIVCLDYAPGIGHRHFNILAEKK